MTTFAAISQPNNNSNESKDSAAPKQQFYFPAKLYADSVAFEQAVPKLAEDVLAVYKEPKAKKYAENGLNFYFFTSNYQKIMEMLDSLQKFYDDNFFGVEIKSWALAKMKQQTEHIAFEETFQKEFSQAFNRMSFQKRVGIAGLDSTWFNYAYSDYADFKKSLEKKGKDSIDLADALSLYDKMFRYRFYSSAYPWMSPQIGDPKYKTMFPAIKSNEWGVVPVEDLDEIPDPKLKYKLLFEITGFGAKGQEDSVAKKEINMALKEVGRQLNLHEANGIPRKNIFPVLVVHAGAINTFLNNEKYKKKYGLDNPNLKLIKELMDYGTKIIVCGQALTFMQTEKEDLIPGIRKALTAQTVISSYQLMGYVYYDFSPR